MAAGPELEPAWLGGTRGFTKPSKGREISAGLGARVWFNLELLGGCRGLGAAPATELTPSSE